MIEHALYLARVGFQVFPLFPLQPGKAKVPALPRWPELASMDEATLRDWWSGSCVVKNERTGRSWTIPHNAAVGIKTSGLIVLDVDIKHGDAAKASLQQLLQAGIPKTLTNVTATGGLHLIYKANNPEQVKNQVGIMPGIDIRGHNGYIVGPGSTVGDHYYALKDPEVPVKTFPPHLEEWVIGASAPADNPNADLGGGNGVDYSTLPDSVPVGGRDDALFKYACSWRERGLTREQAEIMMRTLFERVEQPPGDEITPGTGSIGEGGQRMGRL